MVTRMISNITYKATAYMQLSLHKQLQVLAQTHPYAAVPATFAVCMLDVAAETVKRPVAAVENVASSIINTLGSSCFKGCSLPDACQGIKTAGTMLSTTVNISIASPLNLFERLLVNLSDPKNAHSCNKEADEQANFPAIAYDSNERRALQRAVENTNLAIIEEILASDVLTNQSLGRVLEDAVENGHIDAVSMLLAEPKRLTEQSVERALQRAIENTNLAITEKILASDVLTNQSLGRVLEDAAENGHIDAVSMLLAKLIKSFLVKYNRGEVLSLLDKEEFQEDSLFINICLSKAKKIATSNGYLDLISNLDATAKSLELLFNIRGLKRSIFNSNLSI